MVAGGAADAACHPALGTRRRPEATVLHRVVREELRSFVARRREPQGEGLPRFVESELERYLGCGQLAHGFLRVRCGGCGAERLVAFSCKGRGLCPSCMARRMTDTAARLVDRVLPVCGYRQWVLTVPFALRHRLASDTRALTHVLNLFHRGLRAEVRRRARALRLTVGEPAAVTVVQRFGGALNLHVHFHAIVAEALFTRDGAMVELPPPTGADVERALSRVVRKLRRAGLLAGAEAEPSALAEAQQRSLLSTLVPRPLPGETETRAKRRCARFDGFTLHANVFVRADNREALERLCRYAARPSFSLGRLRELPGGKLAYALKRPLANGARELHLDRDQLLERLSVLVPPPRANLVRYFGVLAPGSKRRRRVVPRAPGPGSGAPERPRGRMDWASLLWRVYKVDAFTCAACGGKARVIAAIRDREVVKKILRHLKLPERAPVILPAREAAQRQLPFAKLERELELDEPVAIERLPSWMRELPRPERARRGPRRARRSATGVDAQEEQVDVEQLPAWMRAGSVPPRPGSMEELPDETPPVERLPAWMRVAHPRDPRKAHWHLRPERPHDDFYPDEPPVMERLPGWMRRGWLNGPAPPQVRCDEGASNAELDRDRWDGVDPPAPEFFVDDPAPEELSSW